MIEVTVVSLGVDQNTKSPVVVLREKNGTRVLPIWIGSTEANAIAMELAGLKFERPLTHDLIANLRGDRFAINLDAPVDDRCLEPTARLELGNGIIAGDFFHAVFSPFPHKVKKAT